MRTSLVDNITVVLTWPPSGTFSVPAAGLGPVATVSTTLTPSNRCQEEQRARGVGAAGRSSEGIPTATPHTLLPPPTELLMTFQAQPRGPTLLWAPQPLCDPESQGAGLPVL